MAIQTTHLLHGLVAAAHTPFHADGSLNLGLIERQASHFLTNQLKTVFVGGSTGECHSLTVDERRQLAQRWSEVVRGTALKLVIHVGANCLADSRTLAMQAEALGAMAISTLSPSYFRPRDVDALIACCAEVAGAAPRTPFYFYDIPVMTGVGLSMPEFLARAPRSIPTLAGIKFTNSDLMSFQLCLRAGEGRFDVPYGTDEWLLAACALGAKGAVGSSFNFAAPVYHRLLAAFARGDLESARSEQFRSVLLVKALASRGYLASSKALMKMLGVDVGPVRLPNVNLTGEQADALRRELETIGFFGWL
jgi:N-acetylneuraminate lyase